jgi:hypothetical protein
MTNQLVLAGLTPESREAEPLALTPAQARLRKMVLDAELSPLLASPAGCVAGRRSPFLHFSPDGHKRVY